MKMNITSRTTSILTRFIALIGIALISPSVFGQVVFQRVFGGSSSDYSRTVEQTPDGGYIIAESTESFGAGSRDAYLVKTDSDGNLEWAHAYGGAGWDAGWAATNTSDGGYILTGNTSDFGAGGNDLLLIKTDGLGNEIWSKTYGGPGHEMAYFVIETTDEGFLAAGETKSIGAGSGNLYAIKTDANGDTLWTKTYGGGEFMSVQQASDGGYIFVGYRSEDFYLVKTNSSGNIEWTKTYGGNEVDFPYSVMPTTDGGYIVCGRTRSFGAGFNDVYVIKTDNLGDTLWTKVYGDTGDDWGFDIQEAQDGGFLIAGFTDSYGAGDNDVFVIKTNSIGDPIWSKVYGGTDRDDALAVRKTTDGGYIISGRTYSFGQGGFDIYLIKIDEEGYSGGCNEATVTTIARNTATIVGSGSGIEYSGADVGTATAMLSNTSTIQTDLCFDTIVVSVNAPFAIDLVEMNIYPNPTTGYLTVEGSSIDELTVSILDPNGKLILDVKNVTLSDTKVKFDLVNYAPGVYFVRVQTPDKVTFDKVLLVK